MAYAIFAIFKARGRVLQRVYPSELFPTEMRASAVGFATAVSCVGAAVGTFRACGPCIASAWVR